MISHTPPEITFCIRILYSLLEHLLRAIVLLSGPAVGVGTQHGRILVILPDDVVADAHGLDVAVEITGHRLFSHVRPVRSRINLIVHDPMGDSAEDVLIVVA